MYTTIRPKLLGSSFIYLFHLYTTTRPKSGSFLLFNLFTYNCANILYATFMAVLIYSVHCIHGGTALIFRTLCPWLYEVFSDHVSKDLSARALRMENERWMLWKCQTFFTNSLNFQAYLSKNTSNIFRGNLKFPEH